jgi:hypothetical protein
MNIMPEGDDIRKAVKWISEQHLDDPGKDLKTLAREASVKFDLSPVEADFLERFVIDQPPAS